MRCLLQCILVLKSIRVLERVESSHRHGEGERFSGRFNSGQWGSNGSVIPKVTKLDFPLINGMEDLISWVCRAEKFFEFQKIPTKEQLPLVAYHFEGEAQLWYQLLQDEGEELTWTTLKEGLYTRYRPTKYVDVFGDLTKLKQTRTVREYQSQFERLLSRVGKLPGPQQVGCFISSLNDYLRVDIKALKPTTLTFAVGLARLYEAKNQNQQRVFNTSYNKKPVAASNSSPPQSMVANTDIQRLNPTEIKEWRDKGLCFYFDEKFGPSHHCKHLFSI